MAKLSISTLLISFALTHLSQSCGVNDLSKTQEAWDEQNRPLLMDVKDYDYTTNYVYEWQKLPLEGQLQNRPWSDDYWPSFRGGLSYRWNDTTAPNQEAQYAYDVIPTDKLDMQTIMKLSPAEKLDLYMGYDQYPNTMSERYRTQVLKTVSTSVEYEADFKIPSWEGLCHAWAPASLYFKEPRSVTVTNAAGQQIAFGSSDVKALLTYHLHRKSIQSAFLGMRCNTDFSSYFQQFLSGEITLEQLNAQKETSACRDTNAGAFHVVLSNQIGRLNEGFIADVSRDLEVWNHPVYRYRSVMKSESAGASPGAAEGTVKEISLETEMYYAGETSPHWDLGPFTFLESQRTYKYRIEIDSDNRIIGGAWLDEQRPDFLWKAMTPSFEGTEELAIKTIYEASISGS